MNTPINEVSIECPRTGLSASNCNWIAREGFVRDYPEIGVQECSNCGLVTHKQDLRAYVNYESGTMNYWASGYGEDLSPPIADIDRRITSIKNLLKGLSQSATILDFGSGSGVMLEHLSKLAKSYGLEPDTGARNESKKSGHQIFSEVAEIISAGIKFDVVTLFHVVEHFYEPTSEFESIYKILKPGGLVLIETPNADDALLVKYKCENFQKFSYWSHHPMLHSKNSLESILIRSGFEIVNSTFAQRYNLNNHLYWLSNGAPGGHDVWKDFITADGLDFYANSLIDKGLADTLWVVARKKSD